jgi:TRAP-type C4-dicarboxylate transport system substrate-binding protein
MVGYVRSKGVQIINLTPEEREKFLEACKPVYDKWIEIIGKDLVELAKKDMGQ